jgi:hypothetical protein
MSDFQPILHICGRRIALVALACALIGASIPIDTSAQCPAPPPTSPLGLGEIGLFFDPAGIMTCAEVPLGTAVPLYLVARAPVGGIASYAISELLAPQGVFVSSPQPPPYGLFNIIFYSDACNTAERIDPGTCPATEGELLVLAIYDMVFFASGGTLCFQTACPTIEGLLPMNPYHTRCDTGGGELVGGGSMCIGLGQGPVSVDSATWSAIKLLHAID